MLSPRLRFGKDSEGKGERTTTNCSVIAHTRIFAENFWALWIFPVPSSCGERFEVSMCSRRDHERRVPGRIVEQTDESLRLGVKMMKETSRCGDFRVR